MKRTTESGSLNLFEQEEKLRKLESEGLPISAEEKNMTPLQFAEHLEKQRGVRKTKRPSEARQEEVGYL